VEEGSEVIVEDVKCDFDWDNASTDDDRFEASVENVARSKTWEMKPHGMGLNGYIVYSFWDDNKICIYIGITNEPWNRIGNHIRKSKFAWEIFEWRVEAGSLDKTTALRLETVLIRRWNPRCNDRKSIYDVVEHTPISSRDAYDVYFERACRGTGSLDRVTGVSSWSEYGYASFPQIVQDHGIRFQKWLQDHPDIPIRIAPHARGINWSSILSIARLSFLQDVEEDAA